MFADADAAERCRFFGGESDGRAVEDGAGPIALGMGKPGSEIQAPMAIVIFCGLLTSAALNMVVVRAAYFRFRRVNGQEQEL